MLKPVELAAINDDGDVVKFNISHQFWPIQRLTSSRFIQHINVRHPSCSERSLNVRFQSLNEGSQTNTFISGCLFFCVSCQGSSDRHYMQMWVQSELPGAYKWQQFRGLSDSASWFTRSKITFYCQMKDSHVSQPQSERFINYSL